MTEILPTYIFHYFFSY